MFQYRVSKYNPKMRDDNQSYTKDEWTSFSDIGKEFPCGRLTEKEYLEVEKNYINFIYELFNVSNIKNIKIIKQEPENIFKKTFFDIEDDWLYIIIQQNIREKFWCKLKSELFEIYMGYDLYLHIDCMNDVEKVLERLAKKHDLYIEKVF